MRDEGDVALGRGRQDFKGADVRALKDGLRLHAARSCDGFQLDEVFVLRPNISDPALQGPVAVELVDDLIGVDPRPVHPQRPDPKALEHRDEAGGMIVIGVRHDDVVDDDIAPVILLDVLDDRFAVLGVATIDQVQPIPRVVPVLD
jgi:hypothetical protein